MLLALREGVVVAAEKTETPEPTIYTWFQQAGGLAEVRSFVEAASAVTLSRAEQAVYEEVERRLRGGKMPDTELMTTFRRLVEARLVPATGEGAQAGAAAQAVVKTEIHLHFDEPGT